MNQNIRGLLSWRTVLTYFDEFHDEYWMNPTDFCIMYFINRWSLLNHLKHLRAWGLIRRRRREEKKLGYEYQITEFGRKKVEYFRTKPP